MGGGRPFSVGAAGISSWERCCLGVPTLMVVSADNQRFGARELEKAGAVSLIGDVGGLSNDALTDRVRRFINDDEALAAMARAAERVCDGRGVRRATMALVPASSKDGGRVRLRPVTMADTDTLLRGGVSAAPALDCPSEVSGHFVRFLIGSSLAERDCHPAGL